MLVTIPEEPWATVCTDFVGPLPRTKHGNSMLLVFFDRFSKWIELVPLRKATAESVVKSFRERILARFGTPKVLITDNGSQFSSRILQKYLQEIGVRQQFTAPYCPQENPTERANRTIKTMIAQITKNQHNRWDEHLPEITLAVNTSTSESTGYSPAYLVQCREPRLPGALYDEMVPGTGSANHDPGSRAQELQEVFKIVRHQLGRAAEDQRRHYNLRRRPWKPKAGDLVWVRQHPLSKAVDNFAAKLAPKFGGPYEVLDFTSPVIVRIKDLKKDELKVAHLSELKPYVDSTPLETNSTQLNPVITNKALISSPDIITSYSTKITSNLSARDETDSDTMVHTKGYYKQQWLEHQSGSTPGRGELAGPAADKVKPYPTMPACYVRLERLNGSEGPPAKAPCHPTTDVIEISSDSDPELTPPRKIRSGSHPPTPSPTVSPARWHDYQGAASWVNARSPLPLTPGHRRPSVTSTSSAPSTSSATSSSASTSSSSISTTSASSTATIRGRATGPKGESQPERVNMRLESTRQSYTPPRPQKTTDKQPQPAKEKEQRIGGRPFQCYEVLSEEALQGLEPHVNQAWRSRRGNNRYAIPVMVKGQRYRIIISHRGVVTVQVK